MANPIPLSIRLSVIFVLLSEYTGAIIVPTYIAYMVHEFIAPFTPSEDLESHISYNVGILEGMNKFMVFLSCIIWGCISDRIGRKPCLLINLSGIAISSVGLGLSDSVILALLWRMTAGISGGTITIMKAMLRDLSDDSNIAVLYSYLSIGNGIAAVLGSLIAGILSHPYRQFGIFDTEFFHSYPYVLPQFIQ